MTQTIDPPLKRFATFVGSALAKTLSQSAHAAWTVRLAPEQETSGTPGPGQAYRLALDGSLNGVCFVELIGLDAAALAAGILGEDAASLADEHSERRLAMLRAAGDELAATLTASYGLIKVQTETAAEIPLASAGIISLLASDGAEGRSSIRLHLDQRLLESVQTIPETVAYPPQEGVEASGELPAEPNLNLILDVELSVTLRFGQRTLPLRDVLELATGSVIELDQRVEEPVELLLDGRVLARGEAVIVDGNYGLRVTELPQPFASQWTRE